MGEIEFSGAHICMTGRIQNFGVVEGEINLLPPRRRVSNIDALFQGDSPKAAARVQLERPPRLFTRIDIFRARIEGAFLIDHAEGDCRVNSPRLRRLSQVTRDLWVFSGVGRNVGRQLQITESDRGAGLSGRASLRRHRHAACGGSWRAWSGRR